MKAIIKACVFLATFAVFANVTRATVVSALYNFNSNNGSPSDGDPNSTAGTLTLHGYGPATKFDKSHIAFGAGGPDIGDVNENTSKYVAFTVNFTSAVDLSSLTFNFASANNNKNVNWVLRSSVDSYASIIGSGSSSSTTVSLQTINFGTSFKDLSTVTFHLDLWNGNDGAGATIDDVTLYSSDVSPVPEPVNTALVVFGGMAGVFGCVRTYRRKNSTSQI